MERKVGLNIPHQPTVPPMPKSFQNEPFEPDQIRNFTITVYDEDKCIDALLTLQRAGYHIIQTHFDPDESQYIVTENPHESKQNIDLAYRIQDILIEEGQTNSSKYGFKLGDTIKFTPFEVADVLDHLTCL